MDKSYIVQSCVVALVMLTAAAFSQDLRERKIVPTGIQREIGFATIVDENCHQLWDASKIKIEIIRRPSNGIIIVKNGIDNPYFPYYSEAKKCSLKKVPGFYLYYKSTSGYIGADIVIIKMIAPSGDSLVKEIAIDVR